VGLLIGSEKADRPNGKPVATDGENEKQRQVKIKGASAETHPAELKDAQRKAPTGRRANPARNGGHHKLSSNTPAENRAPPHKTIRNPCRHIG